MKRPALLALLATFINTACAGDGQWQTLTYSSNVPGIHSNPLRGFLPYEGSYSNFPHSMEYFYLPLRSLMNGPDSYDWRTLEQHLGNISRRGHQAVLRIQLDTPGEPTGIPQYLLDGGLKTWSYSHYDNKGKSLLPDWNDPRLVQALTSFIGAFGARYDGDARIGFITAGLYGFWGEWHTYPLTRREMNETNRSKLMSAYQQAFKKTQIQLRVPASSNATLLRQFGYHDDMFADSTLGPDDWHFWPTLLGAGLGDIWKNRAISGEVAPALQAGLFNNWPNSIGQDVGTAIRTTHVSWLLNHGLFEAAANDNTVYSNALQAQQTMGYQLFASAARVPDIASGAKLVADVQLGNKGVAPFYYNWPVDIGVLNGSGQLLKSWSIGWTLNDILPGSSVQRHFEMAGHGLADGSYKLALRIRNPLGNGQPVKLANLEQDLDASGWLSLQAFKVGAGGSSTPPASTTTQLMLDDFNDSNTGINAFGLWTGANGFVNGSGQQINGALVFDYADDGYFGSSINRSLSSFSTLALRLRGANGGEQNHFHLQLGGVDKAFASLTSSAISSSYQTIRIPFSAFGSAFNSGATVDALRLSFWFGYSGRIEIDSIWFE